MMYDKVKVGDIIEVEFNYHSAKEIRTGVVKAKGIDAEGPYANLDVIKYSFFVVLKNDDKNIIKRIYTFENDPEYFL